MRSRWHEVTSTRPLQLINIHVLCSFNSLVIIFPVTRPRAPLTALAPLTPLTPPLLSSPLLSLLSLLLSSPLHLRAMWPFLVLSQFPLPWRSPAPRASSSCLGQWHRVQGACPWGSSSGRGTRRGFCSPLTSPTKEERPGCTWVRPDCGCRSRRLAGRRWSSVQVSLTTYKMWLSIPGVGVEPTRAFAHWILSPTP